MDSAIVFDYHPIRSLENSFLPRPKDSFVERIVWEQYCPKHRGCQHLLLFPFRSLQGPGPLAQPPLLRKCAALCDLPTELLLFAQPMEGGTPKVGGSLGHEGPCGLSKHDVPLAHHLWRTSESATSNVRPILATLLEDAQHSHGLHG